MDETQKYLELLDSDQTQDRINAANWLGMNKVTNAVGKLIQLLEHPNVDLRREAVFALRRLRDEKASIPMIQRLNDDDDAIRRSASTWFMTLTGDQSHLTEALCNIMLAEESRTSTRDFAAMLLGKFGDNRAVEPLHQLIGRYPRIRLRATLSLGRVAAPRSVPILSELLKDSDIRVQKTAAKVLKQIGTADALMAVQHWSTSQS